MNSIYSHRNVSNDKELVVIIVVIIQ